VLTAKLAAKRTALGNIGACSPALSSVNTITHLALPDKMMRLIVDNSLPITGMT